MKYPHFFPVTRKCIVPETRFKMEKTYQSRCLKANTPIIEQLIELRQKQADLLGYKNHASYVQELRMAKNPERVGAFLSGLAAKLQPIWAKEREEMLQLKEAECREHNISFSGTLDFWDVRHYMTKVEEQKYSVDQEKLKEYFPMEKVTQGLLDIYQSLLGLSFELVKGAKAWHQDVQLVSFELLYLFSVLIMF